MNTRSIGNKGELAAQTFLVKKGFQVVQRNYQKKWGEIDIIATREGMLHFFEVKSVTFMYTDEGKGHRPENNVHGLKVRSIRRMIETYMDEEGKSAEIPFNFTFCVFL